MAHETHAERSHDFPAGIGNPATQALLAAGYTTLEQLTRVSEAEILGLHGVGPKAIGIIRSALGARGQSFAEPVKRGRQSAKGDDR